MTEQLPLTRNVLPDVAADGAVCMTAEPISETAEVELWNALMQTAQEYAQSLTGLESLILDGTDFSLPINRRRIEEAAEVRQSAFTRYRRAKDQLTAYQNSCAESCATIRFRESPVALLCVGSHRIGSLADMVQKVGLNAGTHHSSELTR